MSLFQNAYKKPQTSIAPSTDKYMWDNELLAQRKIEPNGLGRFQFSDYHVHPMDPLVTLRSSRGSEIHVLAALNGVSLSRYPTPWDLMKDAIFVGCSTENSEGRTASYQDGGTMLVEDHYQTRIREKLYIVPNLQYPETKDSWTWQTALTKNSWKDDDGNAPIGRINWIFVPEREIRKVITKCNSFHLDMSGISKDSYNWKLWIKQMRVLKEDDIAKIRALGTQLYQTLATWLYLTVVPKSSPSFNSNEIVDLWIESETLKGNTEYAEILNLFNSGPGSEIREILIAWANRKDDYDLMMNQLFAGWAHSNSRKLLERNGKKGHEDDEDNVDEVVIRFR